MVPPLIERPDALEFGHQQWTQPAFSSGRSVNTQSSLPSHPQVSFKCPSKIGHTPEASSGSTSTQAASSKSSEHGVKRKRGVTEQPLANHTLVPFITPSSAAARSIDHATTNPSSKLRQIVPYPAPPDILAASHAKYRSNVEAAHQAILNKRATDPTYNKEPALAWTIWEDDLVIGHMLDIRLDPSVPLTEARFEECSRRLRDIDHVDRAPGAVKNMWNRIGRARSGFDERKSKSEVYATSQQSKKAKVTG